jgi:transcription termination factor NusB
VLDEAVELAKRFGEADSPAFVNGVLDAIRRRVRGEAARELRQE